MRLVLALSALHLGHCQQDRRSFYVAEAEKYYAVALRTVTDLLLRLDPSNCEPMWLSSVLICFYHFGRGPRPGEFLAFSEHGEAEWLTFLRGVREVTESQNDTLKAGLLAPVIQSDKPQIDPLNRSKPVPEYRIPLQQVRQLIIEKIPSHDPNLQTYLREFDSLFEAFTAKFEGLDDITDESSRYSHIVFAWLYRISADFALRLQQKEPIALVILAYFVVLMKELDSVWFISPWIEHVMAGIDSFLSEDYRIWIQWPIEQIRSLRT